MLVKNLQKLSIPEDKDILYLKPEAARWPELLNINTSALCNIPRRTISREELVNSAIKYTRDIIRSSASVNSTDRIIASGHQPIWHHLGLWIKDVTASRFAELTGGFCLHLIVDHNRLDTSMILPKKNKNGAWAFETIQLEQNAKDMPIEFRDLPDDEKVRVFLNSVTKALPDALCSDIWSRRSLFQMNFSSHLKKTTHLVTYLESLLNKALGLKIVYLPVSQLSRSTAFLEFTASIITQAGSFAHCFNKALDKQIQDWKIKPHQTIRPLSINQRGAWIELPFWLLRPDAKPCTLFVENNKSYKNLYDGKHYLGRLELSSAGQLKKILESSDYFIRPKAVTLTLFVRLLLADWFIHGVGGAKYEYITDYLLRHYYRLEELYFGIATTTMTLSMVESAGSTSKNKQELKKKIRHLKYNPEKFLNQSLSEKHPVMELIKAKRDLVRTASDKKNPSDVRNSSWKSISEVNNKLLSFNKDYLKDLNEKLKLSQKLDASRDVLEYRKFFFGLFPKDKLRKILETGIFI